MQFSIFCTQETFLTLCFYAKLSLLSTLKTVVLLNIFEETMIQGFFVTVFLLTLMTVQNKFMRLFICLISF